MGVLEEETIGRIKSLLRQHQKGMMISDLSSQMKISRNIMSKYLQILLMSGQVEMEVRGNAKVYSLSRRVPISDMFEFSSDYVIVLDGRGKILWVNTPVLSLLGKNPDNFAGKSLREIDDPFFSCLPLGENPETGDHTTEICCQLNEETLYFRVKQTPTVLADGSTGSILTCNDITAERIYQQMVDLSETRFRAIVEDQTEFIVRFLPDGTLTFVNGSYARHRGKKPEELAGTRYLSDIREEERALIYGQIRSLNRNNAITSLEVREPCGNKKTCRQQWTVRALYDNAGNLVEYQGVGRDITEQAEAVDRVQRHAADMEFIAKKIHGFMELSQEADLYAAIGEGLSELLPDAVVAVSSITPSPTDPGWQTLTIRYVCGIGGRELFRQISGIDLVGFTYSFNDPAAIDYIKMEGLHKAFGDLYSCLFGKVPYLVCRQIEEAINLGDTHIHALVSEGQLIGEVAIYSRKGYSIANPGLVEAFLQQASLVLSWRMANEALHKSEAQFRAIVEDQMEFIVRFLPDGILTFVNRSYAHYTGKRPEELTGTSFLSLVPETDRALFDEQIRSLGPDHAAISTEVRVPLGDGRIRRQQWTVRALFDPAGNLTEYQGVGRDITEQAEAADHIHRHAADMEFISGKAREFLELPAEADIYAAIAEGLSELLPKMGICVSSFDPKSRILTAKNVCGIGARDTFQRIAGFDLVGFSFVVNDPVAIEFMKQNRLQKAFGDLYTAMFGQAPYLVCKQVEESLNLEEIYVIGLVSQGELLGDAAIFPRKGDSISNPELIEAFLQQVSLVLAWRIANEALQKSEARFCAIVEDQTEFIARFLPDGTLTFANAPLCGAMNKDPADLLGRSFFTMIPDDDRRILTTSLKSLTVENPKTISEHRLTGPDGEIRWSRWTNRAIFDDRGQIMEYNGIGRDITDLHEAAVKSRKHLTDMKFLARSAGELVRIRDPDNLYRFVSEKVRNLLPGSLVAIMSFDQPGRMLKIVRVDGDPKAVGVLKSELNRDLPGMSFSIDGNTEHAALLTSRHLVPGPTLTGWLAGSIPRETCARMSERLNLGRAYVMGLGSSDGTTGSVIIQLNAGKDISNRELIEAFVSQSAIALARGKEEQG